MLQNPVHFQDDRWQKVTKEAVMCKKWISKIALEGKMKFPHK